MGITQQRLDGYTWIIEAAASPSTRGDAQDVMSVLLSTLLDQAQNTDTAVFMATRDRVLAAPNKAPEYELWPLYSWFGERPQLLSLIIEVAPTDTVYQKIERQTVVELADKMAGGWLPEEWVPVAEAPEPPAVEPPVNPPATEPVTEPESKPQAPESGNRIGAWVVAGLGLGAVGLAGYGLYSLGKRGTDVDI